MFVFVVMLIVLSYGYVEVKLVKCEKFCFIEKKQNGIFIFYNEYLFVEIDNLGRIIILILNGEERYIVFELYRII